MENGLLGFIVLLFLLGTSLTLLTHQDWRWVLAALGLQYFFAFLLILPSWPLELAAVKLVSGWMSGAVLGLTRLNIIKAPSDAEQRLPTSPAFQVLSAALVILVVIGAAPGLADWTRQLNLNQAWGGLLLMGIGLLQVGLRGSSFRNIIGLLSLLCGFEILYAAVEASLLVAALLGILNLGIAFVGSYLLLSPGLDPLE
ncbi:MAG: hypothetical protein M1347_02170 [Chloroflexi bacterium]|nr:hypothetical protein [Chloroflexota bacterium]